VLAQKETEDVNQKKSNFICDCCSKN